jgi:ABC-type sugar transport system permease subunit
VAQKKRFWAAVFLSLPLSIYTIIVILPLFSSFYFSLTDWNGFSKDYNLIGLAVIKSLKSFDIVYIMTGGGPFHKSDTLAMFMYLQSFKSYYMGYGSAIAVVLFNRPVDHRLLFPASPVSGAPA